MAPSSQPPRLGTRDLAKETLPLGGDLPVATGFQFTVDNHPIGVFREVSGLGVHLETEDIKEGGQNGFVHKVPGRMVWEPIVFKRGLTNGDALFKWFFDCSGEKFAKQGNKVHRSSGAIVALTMSGRWLRAWDVVDAFPISWTGPEFGSDKHEPLVETLTIIHHGFKPRTLAK
jgi:phage tail-like protein